MSLIKWDDKQVFNTINVERLLYTLLINNIIKGMTNQIKSNQKFYLKSVHLQTIQT